MLSKYAFVRLPNDIVNEGEQGVPIFHRLADEAYPSASATVTLVSLANLAERRRIRNFGHRLYSALEEGLSVQAGLCQPFG